MREINRIFNKKNPILVFGKSTSSKNELQFPKTEKRLKFEI